jgi:hypothetical protein
MPLVALKEMPESMVEISPPGAVIHAHTRRPNAMRVTFVSAGLSHALLFVLSLYRAAISPLVGPCCRFVPSCSEYAGQAVRRYGPVRGVWMALRRMLRCHPFHPGGWDPVA